MKEIKIEYRRWWRSRSRTLMLPERWDELTARQFLAAVNRWCGKLSVTEFLCAFFDFTRREVSLMDEYQRWVLLHETDWLQSMKRPHNAFFLERLPGTEMFAPGMRLKGCSLQQFMVVDSFFSRYTIEAERWVNQPGAVTAKSTDVGIAEDMLNNFIAALYKRKDEYFTVAEAKQENIKQGESCLVDTDEHLKVVSKLPEDTKLAIYMNFVLIKSWLTKAYTHLFPEADDLPQVSNHPVRPKPTDWLAVFDAFVGDNIAEIERYKAMAVTDAFRIMNRRIRESKKRR